MENPDSPPKNGEGAFYPPLLISMIGILSTSIALIVYHFLLVKLCLMRSQRNARSEMEAPPAPPPEIPSEPTGVDQKLLETIPIIPYYSTAHLEGDDHHRFRRDQTECVVCLGELEDREMVRLLPNCKHAFHVLCIDEWFVAHISCPICRSPIVAADPDVLDHDGSAASSPLPPSPSPPVRLPRSSCADHDAVALTGGGNNVASSSGVNLNTQSFARFLSYASPILPNERAAAASSMAVLRRSLSLDQSSVIINIQQQRESEGERDHASPSSSSSKDDLTGSRTTGPLSSMRHLDRVSSKLRMSFSRLRMGKNNDILPY